jgi:HlyD family type I secretion membrane fusion protein
MRRTLEAFRNWRSDVATDVRRPARFGLGACAIAFGGGGLWAATAPLSGAVIAPGVVVATGQNRMVQHLEGGIIDEIQVREGDQVAAGDILVRLNRTAAEAAVERLRGQYLALRAAEARFKAEREGATALRFPSDVEAHAGAPKIAEMIASHGAEFDARRAEFDSAVAVIEQRIAALGEEIGGLEAQRKSALAQLALIEVEIADTQQLFRQGLAQKSRLLSLQRNAAKLDGDQGEFAARIARARQTIAEGRSEIVLKRKQHFEQAASKLTETQAQIADVEERLKAARDVASRVELRAPVNGIVIRRHHNTPGGVIKPGEPVVDILPADESLMVEARIKPEDADAVRPGRPAQLRLTALRQRVTPSLPGTVDYVSADRLVDPQQPAGYYLARIRIAGDLPAKVGKLRPTPGMPVEVLVGTDARTALDYLLGPLTDSLTRAFTEE